MIKPFKVKFTVNEECNSRCVKCNIWKKKNIKERLMSPDDYQKIMRNYENNIYQVSLDGGEIFLRDDILDVIEKILDNGKLIQNFVINTNALSKKTVYEEFVKIISNYKTVKFRVFISLDGTMEHNDYLRGINKSYEKSLKLYRFLKSHEIPNLSIYFQTVITSYNFKEINDWYLELSKPVVFTFFHSNNFFQNSKDPINLTCDFNHKDFISFRRQLLKNYKIEDMVTFFNYLYIRGINSHKSYICSSGKYTLSIGPYGGVSPCSFNDDYQINLFDHSLKIDNILTSEFLNYGVNCKKKCWMNCEAIPSIIYQWFK